jgi:hypothetical protein
MRKSPKFSPEVIERAVRMVFDAKDQSNIDGQKAVSLPRVGQIYFGGVGQFCIGGDTSLAAVFQSRSGGVTGLEVVGLNKPALTRPTG